MATHSGPLLQIQELSSSSPPLACDFLPSHSWNHERCTHANRVTRAASPCGSLAISQGRLCSSSAGTLSSRTWPVVLSPRRVWSRTAESRKFRPPLKLHGNLLACTSSWVLDGQLRDLRCGRKQESRPHTCVLLIPRVNAGLRRTGYSGSVPVRWIQQ